jgi:hypothetical protein
MLGLIIAVAIATGPQQAEPKEDVFPTIRIDRGGTFLIGLDGKGGLIEDGSKAEPLAAHDLEFLARLKTEHSDAMGSKGAIVQTELKPPALRPSVVRFSFVPFEGGKESVLLIENGFPRSFMYRARIGRGKASQPTDVCQILPEKRGYEHWPYEIEWIEITDWHPVDYNPGDPLRCE